MSKKVIDVSSYNGSIDWGKVKSAGVDGAILKIIRKDLNPDKRFEEYWSGCEKAGLPVCGVYNYSYATSVSKAKTDAKKVLEVLNGRKVKVWLDVEDSCQKGLGNVLIDIINAYGTVIKDAGYQFGVYTGLAFYNSYIEPWSGYLKCEFWIARYPSTATKTISQFPATNKQPEISHTLEGWQWSSAGSVPGISARTDLNLWYGEIKEEVATDNPYPIPTRVLYLATLKPKMTGNDVKWVQCHLVRLGFLAELTTNGKTNIDGIFGTGTKNAVMEAQKHYGIKVDGIVGADTRNILRWN